MTYTHNSETDQELCMDWAGADGQAAEAIVNSALYCLPFSGRLSFAFVRSLPHNVLQLALAVSREAQCNTLTIFIKNIMPMHDT